MPSGYLISSTFFFFLLCFGTVFFFRSKSPAPSQFVRAVADRHSSNLMKHFIPKNLLQRTTKQTVSSFKTRNDEEIFQQLRFLANISQTNFSSTLLLRREKRLKKSRYFLFIGFIAIPRFFRRLCFAQLCLLPTG